MITKFRILIFLTAIIVAFSPLVADRKLVNRYNYYRGLQENFGCYPVRPWTGQGHSPGGCFGDFDGDGKTGSVILKNGETEINVVDSGKSLSVMSYRFDEYGKRVYLAIHSDGSRAHLIIFNETPFPTPVVGVFGWDGQRMSQIASSPIEEDILYALRMNAGNTAFDWNVFLFFRKPILFL